MNRIILRERNPNQITRIIIKHNGKYVSSIYRNDIVYGTRKIHARRYKSRTYVNHICEKLNLRFKDTQILYIDIDDKSGEILTTS